MGFWFSEACIREKLVFVNMNHEGFSEGSVYVAFTCILTQDDYNIYIRLPFKSLLIGMYGLINIHLLLSPDILLTLDHVYQRFLVLTF